MEIQKDTNTKNTTVQSMQYNPDLFHNDREFFLVYKKIENISAAVFLITNLVKDGDILKNKLREHCLLCLSDVMSLIGKTTIDVSDLHLLASKVVYTNSLLDIAFWSGIVSQMNISILQKEVSITYKTINDLSAKYKTNFYINSSFFKSDEEIMKAVKEVVSDKGQSKGHTKRQVVKDKNTYKTTKIDSEARLERKQAIISLLKQKSNLSIKDFSNVSNMYSEKTIQRELIALMQEGVVKKEGERRWSTYSLV